MEVNRKHKKPSSKVEEKWKKERRKKKKLSEGKPEEKVDKPFLLKLFINSAAPDNS